MSIRAKMKVESKVQGSPGNPEGWHLVLRPVYGGSPENEEFYKYTPGGQLNLSTINDAAAAQLEVGQEAYIDITPIPRDIPASEPQAAQDSTGAAPAPDANP